MSAFIEDRKAAGFAVELTCRTLGVSVSAYCQRRRSPPSRRRVEDAALVARIREVEDVPLVVELRGGGPVSELSQAGEAATSGAAVVVGV